MRTAEDFQGHEVRGQGHAATTVELASAGEPPTGLEPNFSQIVTTLALRSD